MSKSTSLREIKRARSQEMLSDCNAAREQVLLDLRPAHVQHAVPAELAIIQAKLGFGSTYGYWETPSDWLPAGHRTGRDLRIDFKERLSAYGISREHLENAELCAVRYAVLLAMVPAGMGPANGRYLKPLTLIKSLYQTVPFLIATAASKVSAKDAGEARFFGAFSEGDLEKIASAELRSGVRDELRRALMLCRRELWSDAPSFGSKQHDPDHTPNVKGEAAATAEQKPNKYLPLPDDFVAEGGYRVLWVIQELGPSLIEIGKLFAEVIKQDPVFAHDGNPDSVYNRRLRKFKELLANHRWTDSNGTEIVTPPFPLSAHSYKHKLEPDQWPPHQPGLVLGLLRILQMAHLWVALLSVGSRIGEMLSIAPGSIVHSVDGTPFANGLTFKLVDRVGGAERDWPLPDVALQAVRQQEELCDLIQQLGYLGGDTEDAVTDEEDELPDEDVDVARSAASPRRSIWANVGHRGEFSATNANRELRRMATCLGLTDKPSGRNLSTHRFRKTVARLAALAIAGAPKILMDLFGHKSIEMTLYYILTDPVVQAEVKLVVEEVAILRAKDAVENHESYGGPAARRIAELVVQERARLGRDLGASDIRELAEVLTLNGQSWALVRPGVICTKLPGGSGPCTKKVGRPEPSRCRWRCDHRLEEAYLRDDVDRSIAEAVRLYELECADNNEMGQEFWAGQVLSHLRRFDDIHQKWAQNPVVMHVMSKHEAAA